MASQIRQRVVSAKETVKHEIRKKTKKSGWVLEKQKSTFGEPDQWTNIDMDVTPIERRTWSAWTMLGFCE